VQTNFIALYRGRTVAGARLVAVTAEPNIVDRFLRELTGEADEENRDTLIDREPLRIVQGDEE
jgi:hypothetical protein